MSQNGRTFLTGDCFVLQTDDIPEQVSGGLGWSRVIGAADGARKLSQFHLTQSGEHAPVISAGGSDAVLFILQGNCTVDISGREFSAEEQAGVYVRPGEAFRLRPQGGQTRLLLTCCPGIEKPDLLPAMPVNFDENFPHRTVSKDESGREATGDRFYKLLVGPQTGSREVTQFIGMIPLSKAPEHFHLYEEAICILSGHGRLWAGEVHAPVKPGSIIFLPIRQPHCLECEDEAGMELTGVFYPAGSPAVNYQTNNQE